MASRVLALRRSDACAECGEELPVGARAVWDPVARTVRCLTCAPSAAVAPAGTSVGEVAAPQTVPPAAAPSSTPCTSPGPAGGSAQREYERRHDAREARVRARHPKLGGLLLALVDDPTSTKVWAKGAEGERAVAARLDSLADATVFHDRRLRRPDGPLSQANIDHLAIAPSGVWVIDAKTHHGKLEVRRSGGPFAPRTERLVINGRDQTRLVEGVQRQVDAVRAAIVAISPETDVRGALCFVGTELPWLDEDIAGIPLRGRRGLLKLLRRPGPLDAAARGRIAQHLDSYFPPAT